jgi:NDP-sugar pyrophosphorylase family protein
MPFSQSGNIESGVQLKGKVSIGQDTVIRSNTYIVGPVTIGKGCEIGPNACIFPSTSIGNNVIISPFTELRNCVIGDDVRIASGSSLEDTVMDNGCNIGANFIVRSEETDVKVDEEHHTIKTGAMVGSSCQIGNIVTARAGTIIGNNTQISGMKMISGNIPERSLVV